MYFIKAEIAIAAFLVCVTALAVKVSYGLMWAAPLWIVFIILVVVFRHPKRRTPSSPLAIVAPVDAVVADVFESDESFTGQTRKVVRLRRQHLGVLALYSPIEGQVIQTWYGESYEAPKAADTGARGHIYTAWIRTDESDDMLISFYRARTIRYLQIRPQPGERVGQGKLIGLSSIQYIDILLPLDTDLKIETGTSIKAGEDILGLFIHRSKKRNGNS